MDKNLKLLQTLIGVLDRKFSKANIHDARWAGFMAAAQSGQLPDKAIMRATECLIDHDFPKKAADLLIICCDLATGSDSLLDYMVKVLRQIGLEKEAVAYLKKRLKKDASDWMATKLMRRVFFHQDNRDRGADLVEDYLDAHPDHIPALIEKATIQLVKGGDEVNETLLHILRLDGESLFALSQLVQNRAQTYDFSEAEEYLAKMKTAHPEDAMVPYCEGYLFDQQLQFDKALDCYNQALAINPRFIEAYGKSGGMLAKLGHDLPEAWYRLEARLPQLLNRPDGPFWRGEDLDGKSLLIWAEQGIADQLSFATMFRDLPKGVKEVHVETEPKMVSLFQRTFPDYKIFPRRKERSEEYDFHSPMGSLTNYLRTDLDSFGKTPAHNFVPDEGDAQKWQAWLDSLPKGRKVGLCWRSGVKSVVRARDGLDLVRDLSGLLQQEGLVFINCHYADVSEELDQVANELGVTIYDPPGLDQFDDIDQTAALIKGLDCFVGIATTPTRIAQSVGVKPYMLYVGEPGEVERRWWPETEFFCRTPDQKDWSRQVGDLIQTLNN